MPTHEITTVIKNLEVQEVSLLKLRKETMAANSGVDNEKANHVLTEKIKRVIGRIAELRIRVIQGETIVQKDYIKE